MAIRLRLIDSVGLVALCAARSVEKAGDVYLDDGQHYALAEKFWLDYPDCGITPRSEIRAEIEREESNNPNRAEWDKTFATPTHSPGARFEPQPKFVESVPEKRQDLPASPSVPGDGFDVLRDVSVGEPLGEDEFAALDALLREHGERGEELRLISLECEEAGAGRDPEESRETLAAVKALREMWGSAIEHSDELWGGLNGVVELDAEVSRLRTALEAAEADTRRLTLLERRASAIFVDSRDINASGLSLRAYLDRHFDAASQGASGPESEAKPEPFAYDDGTEAGESEELVERARRAREEPST